MARTGRFGSLPSQAPDLTATIVALIEAAERQRDANILSAWAQGGTFEGKKVTDQRLKAHFRARMREYSKDDPEYDHWKQQYDQVDYDIGESKALLRYEQGGLSESGMASWYTQNAKRFPKNSEAWREAMRNAASFKKAAQQKAKATNTISDYERYNNRIGAINRNYLEPAAKAQTLVDSALKKMGVTAEGFLGLDDDQKSAIDTRLQQFFRNDPRAKELRDRWEKITGDKFSYRSMRQTIRRGERGAKLAVRVSKQFGYSPLQYQELAEHYAMRETSLSVFRSNVLSEYDTAEAKYIAAMEEAKDDDERASARRTFVNTLRGLRKEAVRQGDEGTEGSITSRIDNLTATDGNVNGVRYVGDRANAGVGEQSDYEANTISQVRRTEQGAFDSEYYNRLSAAERDVAFSLYLQENREGIKAGTHVRYSPDGENYITIPRDEYLTIDPNTGLPSVEVYASVTTQTRNGPVQTYVPWMPVQVTAPDLGHLDGGLPEVYAAKLDGTTIWLSPNPETEEMETSTEFPYELAGSDETRTAFGTVHDRIAHEVVSSGGQNTMLVTIRPDPAATIPLGKQEGETEEAYRLRVLGTILPRQTDRAGDIGQLTSPVEDLPDEPGVPGGKGSDIAGPALPTGYLEGQREQPSYTDDDVEAYVEEKLFGGTDIYLRERENAEARGEDPVTWEAAQAEKAKELIEANIAAGLNPSGDAPWSEVAPEVDMSGVATSDAAQSATSLLSPPPIRSESIFSRDKTGNLVYHARSRVTREDAAKLPKGLLAQTTMAANGASIEDPATAELAVEIARGTDAVLRAGAAGATEDQWEASQGGILDLVKQFGGMTTPQKNIVEEGETRSEVRELAEGTSFVKQLTGRPNATREELVEEFPELSDILPPDQFDGPVPATPSGRETLPTVNSAEGPEPEWSIRNRELNAMSDDDFAAAMSGVPGVDTSNLPGVDKATAPILGSLLNNPWLASANADRNARGLPSLTPLPTGIQGPPAPTVPGMTTPPPAAVQARKRADVTRFNNLQRFIPTTPEATPNPMSPESLWASVGGQVGLKPDLSAPDPMKTTLPGVTPPPVPKPYKAPTPVSPSPSYDPAKDPINGPSILPPGYKPPSSPDYPG